MVYPCTYYTCMRLNCRISWCMTWSNIRNTESWLGEWILIQLVNKSVSTTHWVNSVLLLEDRVNNLTVCNSDYRLFEGSTPVLLVSDAEWLKEAYIKNFNLTMDRRPISLNEVFDGGIFTTQGEHWKHARAQISPAFSSGKLKQVKITS